MQGYYINLKHRKDRKHHIETNIKTIPFLSKCVRLDAVRDTVKGYVGCAKSHILALEKLYRDLENENDAGIILEDDLCVIDNSGLEEFTKQLQRVLLLDNWDLITLTPRGEFIKNVDPDMERWNFYRMVHTQTATGYIIRKRMILSLLELWRETCGILERFPRTVCPTFCCDQSWKTLHTIYRVFAFHIPIFGQLCGYSDIEHTDVNYNNHFTTA